MKDLSEDQPDKLISASEAMDLLGIKKSAFYDGVKEYNTPRPRRINKKSRMRFSFKEVSMLINTPN